MQIVIFRNIKIIENYMIEHSLRVAYMAYSAEKCAWIEKHDVPNLLPDSF